ncbi:MAG: tRNA lysidine(34) synthetase TilS, partial [Phycisphaerales bacterium]|nr:tRNA lysidine(34) synthetase TilS [Phycisphaerales bacterium]
MYTTNRASPAQVCVVRVPDRRAPVVRDVVRAWRRLTGEGAPRTVVACSGGADSVALLLSLASVTRDLVVVYIRHDMRDAAIVEAECRRVADLADALGLHFESGEAPTDRGNLEAQARAGRYAALADSARNCAAPFVATGHHADDQLETMVMGLLRGSGPAGLSGVAECRLIDDRADEVRLIRPLLGIRRADTEALCAEAGWIPCEDETNAGTTRLRSLLRHGVLRELGAAHPDGAVHAARAAAAMHDIDGLLAEVADQL